MPTALRLAQAAFIVGVLYAGVSVYWGLGGTWLVDTVGGSIAKEARAGNAGVLLVVWAAAILKLVAALLPLAALRRLRGPASNRKLSVLTWVEAAILTAYGLVLTVPGLLIQAGVIHESATADHRALVWHAYLWDPWFLIWGLLVGAALLRERRTHARTAAWA